MEKTKNMNNKFINIKFKSLKSIKKTSFLNIQNAIEKPDSIISS